MMKQLKEQSHFFTYILPPAVFFLFTSVLYLHNITRDIYSGDIGDLVTAAFVHGVAHPSGYPLFVFLGFLFSHLPLSLPVVSKVALVSTLSSLIGLFFFYKLSLRITKSVFLSLLSTSILAFSYLFWLHAEIPEVFGLNNFFAIMILYFTVLFHQEEKTEYLYLLTLFLGLSLTHHQTILFIFPAVLLILLKHIRFIFAEKKRILYAILFGILGILPYVYVPIAASTHPPINWDNATTLSNFIHLILRHDYGAFAPNVINTVPLTIKIVHVKGYIKDLISLFSYQIIVLGLFGLLKLFKIDKLLFSALLLAFLLSGPFFAFYGANIVTTTTALGVIERFYTLSSVIFVFFIPYGFLFLKELLFPRFSRPYYGMLLISYFLIIPYFLITVNNQRTDLSKTQIGNNYAASILSSLPKNSVLFVTGDTTTFNIWYNYYVLGKRNDIALINPKGVGGNYYLDDEINLYHNKHPHVPFNKILEKTIEEISHKKKIYATYEMQEIPIPQDKLLIPKGLVYELVKKDSIPKENDYIQEVESLWKKIEIKRRETLLPSEQNLVVLEIPMFYSNGLVHIGDFLAEYYNDPQRAESYYRRALWIDDQNPTAYAGLALSQYKAYRDCNNAISNMKTAMSLYPIWEKYYVQLYIMYQGCHVNKQSINELQKEYSTYFKRSIDTVVSRIQTTR